MKAPPPAMSSPTCLDADAESDEGAVTRKWAGKEGDSPSFRSD